MMTECGIIDMLRSSGVRVLFCSSQGLTPYADGLSNYPNFVGGFVMPRKIRIYPRKSVEERLWPKVNKNGSLPEYQPELGPCWLWMANTNGDGYGTMDVEGHTQRVHRVVYGILRGSIPEGLTLDHLCRVRHCVNPNHLEPVTREENLRRGYHNGGIKEGALRIIRTHCKNGHAFTPKNTIRVCRTCQRNHTTQRKASRGNNNSQ